MRLTTLLNFFAFRHLTRWCLKVVRNFLGGFSMNRKLTASFTALIVTILLGLIGASAQAQAIQDNNGRSWEPIVTSWGKTIWVPVVENVTTNLSTEATTTTPVTPGHHLTLYAAQGVLGGKNVSYLEH